ncbi:MAG: hypothetical protein JWP85_839 [Rhodoglobus sp.]|nr:hypothetical protein [Rhodoglobus sp.]
MPRAALFAPTAAAVLVLALAGCTPAPAETPTPSPTASSTASPGGSAGSLPACDVIAVALGSLLDGLTYSEKVSATNTAQEAYEQRVCVYVTDDQASQLGVTIADIPFQQSELDSYATLPNAIADPRLEASGAVLQTFATGDGDDGHLDSALYLFDTQHSITIQGIGAPDSLPGLTLAAATDGAFAVRALIY